MILTGTAATPHPEDTITAVSSAAGPGVRAIIRISGPNTRSLIDTLFRSDAEQRPPRHLIPGSIRLTGVHSPLPADLYFFPGPHSYTGQDLAEFHTIGSPPLVERLVADLLAAGARPAQAGEFTLRAFLAGKKDLTQAEAVHAVIEARTDDDLRHALAQLAGGVSVPLHTLREDLLNLLADLEAALDFADEDIEFVGQADTLARLESAIAHLDNLQQQLDSRTISGRPVRVAFAGLPNAGKSSLFNALSGSTSAMVSAEAGTTRDYLTKSLTLDGVNVELIDTAGWQDASDTIAEQAQQLGGAQTHHADVILWCVEARNGFDDADASRLIGPGAELIRVHTKCDQPEARGDGDAIRTSIVTLNGIDELRSVLAQRVQILARPALAPSQSRCRHHVIACIEFLRSAHRHVTHHQPVELTALDLRSALDQLGELTGAIFTNDLLDRIFSRFCIGK